MKQKGFTLIELVVVIVILGILAAVALPKFVDLKGDAVQAAVDGAAGAVTSASALNYAKYQVSSGAAEALNGADPCSQLVGSAKPGIGLIGGLPTGVTVTTDTTCASVTAGSTVNCVLTHAGPPTKTSTARIICTG